MLGRRNSIPILYTKGTHYEVGYDMGRTFSGLIHSLLETEKDLQQFLAAWETPSGRKGYDDTLHCCQTNFPQYVRELQGIADGAKVPFHELFLWHMDDVILAVAEKKPSDSPTGCSTVCVNERGQEILGHTEDAYSSILNHFYLVSAHIIEKEPQGKWGSKEEKFTSLCYAGHLPGYTMGYNHHGLVFSINTLSVKRLLTGKTPRYFLTRALLGAENYVQVQQILRDSGCGAGNGCSINATFLKQEGSRMMHNIEMAPATSDQVNESQLSILTIGPGECTFHANSYLRLQVDEANIGMTQNSKARLACFKRCPTPKTEKDVRQILSDKSDSKNPIFRDRKDDFVQTICCGIFNLTEKTWSLYADVPQDNEPLVVLPLKLKN
ncbi:hypothetical protein ABEB36_001175 [Hypothenemus hampei]|uniref:Peptidase C45 hydrolase domain-containing protein n=1 Tax=Hypothenemus hampei TaxID=57062 RepID=A0ABD1FDQ7_HYPHA